MTPGQIVQTFRELAEATFQHFGAEGGYFHYGQLAKHAVESYDQTMPQIHLDTLAGRRAKDGSSSVYVIRLAVLDQGQDNFSQAEIAAVQDNMYFFYEYYMGLVETSELWETTEASFGMIPPSTRALFTGVSFTFSLTVPNPCL